MAKKKDGRASWFKLFLHHKSVIEAVPDDAAGKAFKAALRYFDTGEEVELDSLAQVVFAALKPSIDDAFSDFQAASKKNRQNIKKRWDNRGIPSDTTGNNSIPSDTKNTEVEVDNRSTSTLDYLLSTAPGLKAGEQMMYIPEIELEGDNHD